MEGSGALYAEVRRIGIEKEIEAEAITKGLVIMKQTVW